jgi:hypothetical protein
MMSFPSNGDIQNKEDLKVSQVEVTARVKMDDSDEEREATVSYDFGDSLPEAISLFGEDVVYKRYKGSATVDLQALIRRHLSGDKPKSPEEIQTIVDEWKPGTMRVRKSKSEKALELLAQMSEEEKAELLRELAG